MSTTFMSYGFGGTTTVVKDVAYFVETSLRDLVTDVERDERFRVYGVPGEGYVEITAVTADDDLEDQIKKALPKIEQELWQRGVATAMFTRTEPRVPSGAYDDVWRWVHQEVERSPGFIQLAESVGQGASFEREDWGESACDVESDGTWCGHLRLIVAFNVDDEESSFRRQFETDVSGTISRDGEIEGSFTNWTCSQAPGG
jgi:hypothetical protein